MRQFYLPAFYIIFVILSSTIAVFSQSDPFHINETGPRTVKSQDIFLLWMEDIGSGNIKSYQKVYRYKTEGILFPPDSLNIDTMLTETLRNDISNPGKNAYVDVATGEFNIDPYDDAVSIWRTTNSNQNIEIMISHFDTTGFFTNTTATTLDAGEDIRQDEEIYVRTGNFDSDSTDEFIVAFHDASDSVIFYQYDVDSTLQTTLIKRFSDTKVAGSSLLHFVKYFIETADLNGDGIDELVSFTWETAVQPGYVPVKVRVYAFEGNNIVPKGTVEIQVPRGPNNLSDFSMAAAKGQFDNDDSNELVFGGVTGDVDYELDKYANLYILNFSKDLQNIFVGPNQQYMLSILTPPWNLNLNTEFGLAAGDLNHNGIDEVVFAAGTVIRVCKVNGDYTFEVKNDLAVANGGPNDYQQSYNYLKVCDMNMDNWDDIVIVKNIVSGGVAHGFEVASISFTDSSLIDGTERILGRILGDENQFDVYQKYAIAVGNFDGYDFKIGLPEHSVVYGVAQPIVVLNAPPVHFDRLNGNIYDINTCYNGGNCDFYSKYIRDITQTLEVSTRINSDWVISAGLSYSGSVTVEPMGVGISFNYEAHLLYNYGEHFSKDSSNATTVSITVQVVARDDDRIYATVTDFDAWEYPVFHGNEPLPRNTFLALVPSNVQGTWFGSKSYFAQNYAVDHEVSNILSYYDSVTNNPNVFQLLETLPTDRYVIDGSSSYDPHWTYERFTNVNAETVKENGWDMGYSFGYTFNGDFNNKRAVTNKTSVRSTIDLEVHLGSVNTGIGQVEYAVTPYAYWGKSDALVLDYAVDVPEPPGEDSWWELMYKDYSDPTFILPWFLDPEKGITLSEPAKIFNTKDLLFSPPNPVAGDTLTITARVRNYSLIPTPSSVSVKFYLNDPDSGGTPILGVNGTNTVNTNGPIPSRSRKEVEFKWIVPGGLPPYSRIYAILDQENSIMEIHEDNNKGYAILGASPVSGVEDETYTIPDKYVLYQSYPNPFNPSTTIKYSIPNSDKVSIKVYDILGREVATLVNEYKTAGTYTVEFNANGHSGNVRNLASGVYFYQIQSGNFVETKKMILIK